MIEVGLTIAEYDLMTSKTSTLSVYIYERNFEICSSKLIKVRIMHKMK